jgi:hypothetical protein
LRSVSFHLTPEFKSGGGYEYRAHADPVEQRH